MSDPKRLVSLLLVVTSGLGVVACGGKSSTAKQSATRAATTGTTTDATASTKAIAIPPSSTPPSSILARVAGRPIELGTVLHLMAIANAPAAVPDPPSYSSCIAAMRAQPPNGRTNPASESETQLTQACKTRYEQLLQQSLSNAIHNRWVIGEAAELGVKVSRREVEKQLEADERPFGSNAKFEAYRKSTARTIADLMAELEEGKLTDKIFRVIQTKERPVTGADIAAYYKSHIRQFVFPQGRRIRIVRTATAASAGRAAQEIRGGKSFATVARELSAIGQPLGAKNGEVLDLKPGEYGEKLLNDAIFNAVLHHVYGPLYLGSNHKTIAPETNSGFFIFEVLNTTPARKTPLSLVKNLIVNELTSAYKEQTLAGFVAAYKRKWKDRTDCEPGYVVQYCKQLRVANEVVDLTSL